MRTAHLVAVVAALPLALVAGCSGKEPAPPAPPPAPTSSVPAPPASSAAAAPVGSEGHEGHEGHGHHDRRMPPVTLVAGTPAPAPEKAPSVTLKAPAKDQVVSRDKAGDFEVRLDVKNWDTKDGAHIHLILDGRPYKRIDDPKQPIKLKDIDPNYELKDGEHVLVAFPSRMTHESVKPVGKVSPAAIVPFWIGKKGEVTWKPTDPTLVYSRPKGQNNGVPDEGILVDFYLFNVELGEGKHAVKATLSGPGAADVSVLIKEWRPFRIQQPQAGTYALSLTLVDKDGKPVPGPTNDVRREFQIDPNAPPDPHVHPKAPAAPAPAASASAPKK